MKKRHLLFCLLFITALSISLFSIDIHYFKFGWGYYVLKNKYDLRDHSEVLKHFKKGLAIPKGSSVFFAGMGKDENYVNWEKRFYLNKVGDMDVRTVIINNDYYELYDGEPNPGLMKKSIFKVIWLKRTLIVECKKKTFFSRVGAWSLHENKDFIIVASSKDSALIKKIDYRNILKYKGTQIGYTAWSKKKKFVLNYNPETRKTIKYVRKRK